MNIGELLEIGKTIAAKMSACETADRIVIARYTAAFEGNFTDWIGRTAHGVRHEHAKFALADKLRRESNGRHAELLRNLAKSSDALPDTDDFEFIYEEIRIIRGLFARLEKGGLAGLGLLITLESMSRLFIPDLIKRAKECGCTEEHLKYLEIRDKTDVEDGKAFIQATEAELKMWHADDRNGAVLCGAHAARDLILRIYTNQL